MHLFLSPHFDDAVLSCGGLIHRLTRRGDRVSVLTLMAGDPPEPLPDTPIVRELHLRWQAGHNPIVKRRLEDRQAVESLGARGIYHLEWADCVYRTAGSIPLYPTEESLFGEVHPDDPARGVVPESARLPDTRVLYAPLGIGHHVDHLIARDLGLSLFGAQAPFVLKFYAEYPYTRDVMAETRARDHLALSEPDLCLEPDIVVLAEDGVAAKIAAIACYQSQISTFWANQEAMEADVRQSMCDPASGVYIERYWRIRRQEPA